MEKKTKKTIGIIALSSLACALIGGIIFALRPSDKKTAPSVSIDDQYQRLFEGREVKKANSFGTEGTDYTSDLVYRVNDTTLQAAVSKTASDDTSIVIPYSYSDGTKTYTVTAIDYSGFANCPNLTSVTFQTYNGQSGAANITLMDAQCFASCPNLVKFNSTVQGRFTIPSQITAIHSASFMNCQSMTSLVVDKTANNLASIGDNAFNGCIAWNTSLSLNKHTAGFTIGEAAFANCVKLPQAMLRTGVTSIGAYAFYNDTSLKLVGIPSTCTTIGIEAFRRCESATAYIGSPYRYQSGWPNQGSHATDANDEMTDYTSTQMTGGTCVEGDWNYANAQHAIKIIVNKDDISISPDSNFIYSLTPYSITVGSVTKTLFRITIIQYIGTGSASLVVPDSWDIDAGDSLSWLNDADGNPVGVVTEIASNAFNTTELTSLTLPSTMEKIDSYAFNGSTAISSLTLSETYDSTNDVFTSFLASYIDGTLTNIPVGTYAVGATAGSDNDFALTGLVTISDYAFANSCQALTSLVIPHTVQTIGVGAFAGYVNSIYSSGLPYLRTLSFNMFKNRSSFLMRIGAYAFYKMGESLDAAYYGKCDLLLPKTMAGTSSDNYIIGEYAFFDSLNLGTLVMGELSKSSTTTAGYTHNNLLTNVFNYCSYLKWAYLGNGIYQVGNSAFANCTSMDWLYIAGTVGSSASRVDSSVITGNLHCVVYCGASGTNLSSKFSLGDQVIYSGSDDKQHSKSNKFTYAPVYYGIYGMKGITDVTTWGAYYIYTYDGNLDTPNEGVQMYYTTNANAWTLTKGLSYAGSITSDVSGLGHNITIIGAKSFYRVTNITGLVVTNTVTTIQEYAFCYATNFATFGISGSLTTCPVTLTTIAQYAFTFSGLTALTIDAAITTLGTSTDIGNCFFGCLSLNDLNINTASGQASNATFYCDNDSTIGALYTTSDGTSFNLCIITGSATGHNSGSTAEGTYTIKSGTLVINSYCVLTCRLSAIIIPSSVTTISDYAFHMFTLDPGGPTTNGANCNAIMTPTLTSITFADKTTSNCNSIGIGAFAYQTALTTLELPDKPGSTVVLKDYAFRCCAYLPSLTFPTNARIDNETTDTDNYYKLSGYQFDRCYRLQTVTIPSSINYLGRTVFWGCDLLETVNWTNIKYIDQEAFLGCPSLATIPAFSASLTYIGYRAFYNDTKLAAVDFSACTSLATIGSEAFSGCSTLASLDLSNCTSLTGATSIGTTAFNGCSGLTSVTYAPNVTAVNDNVFKGCTSLVTFTGSSNLTAINTSAFENDSKMTTVNSISNVSSIGNYAFKNCTVLATLNSVSNVETIGTEAFNACRGLTSLTDFTSLVSIGSSAFNNCSNLTLFAFPTSLTTIDSSAFQNCTSLVETTLNSSKLVIPNSVTSIGASAFYNCQSLLDVQYSSGLTSIPDSCFYTDKKMTTFRFNSTSITSIGAQAFQGCSVLANNTGSGTVFTLPNSVTSIGTKCFNGCSAFITVNIGSTAGGSQLGGIPSNAFQGCNKMTTFIFNTGSSYMTTIGTYAFGGCYALTNSGTSKLSSGAVCFSLPDSVTTIAEYAFNNCTNILNFYFGSGIASLGQKIIGNNTKVTIYINRSYGQVTSYMNSAAFNTLWYNARPYYCSSNSGNKPTGCSGYYATNASGLITGTTAG
ncbi:MAG: leucine-rich repeat domain-containing protein [Bacilli bacterium]|jgi:hypothetical protein|nr:leucine-rich repeat domain-containing protein [Bacilli bacterium]